jgi:hypothetical protein
MGVSKLMGFWALIIFNKFITNLLEKRKKKSQDNFIKLLIKKKKKRKEVLAPALVPLPYSSI